MSNLKKKNHPQDLIHKRNPSASDACVYTELIQFSTKCERDWSSFVWLYHLIKAHSTVCILVRWTSSGFRSLGLFLTSNSYGGGVCRVLCVSYCPVKAKYIWCETRDFHCFIMKLSFFTKMGCGRLPLQGRLCILLYISVNLLFLPSSDFEWCKENVHSMTELFLLVVIDQTAVLVDLCSVVVCQGSLSFAKYRDDSILSLPCEGTRQYICVKSEIEQRKSRI